MKFFSWLLLILTVAMIIAMDVLIVYWARWPVWTFVTNIAIILSLFLLFPFFKKWLLQISFRSKRSNSSNLDANEKAVVDAELRVLKRDWRNGIGGFSKQSLFFLSKPRQEVPRFLVLGTSASGKTSLIDNCSVTKRFSRNNFATEEVVASHLINCWRFPGISIVDISGVIIDQENSISKSIWKTFLKLVRRTDRKFSLNGVVVCVDAQNLIRYHDDELVFQGKLIRARMDELTHALGLTLPIYICITKCDKIEGMIEFFSRASNKNMTQAIGQLFSRDYVGKKAKYLVNIAFQNVYCSLSALRIKIFKEYESSNKTRFGVFFPEELDAIKTSLQVYLEPIFSPNGLHDAPMFRALYFTSAQQDGTKFSLFRKKFGINESKQKIFTGKDSYFIRDIFSTILPNDDSVVKFTRKAAGLRSLGYRAGTALWIGLFLSLALTLSFGYSKNAEVMETSNMLVKENSFLDDHMQNRIFDIEKMRHSIEDIEMKLGNQWFSYLGLNQPRIMLDKMKGKYVDSVKNILLAGEDKYLDRSLELIAEVKSPKLTAAYVDFIVKKIGFLTYAIDNTGNSFSVQDIVHLGPPDFSVVNQQANSVPVKEYNRLMLSNYISYIRWQPRKAELEFERDKAKKRLELLYKSDDSNFGWVIDWANHQGSIPEVNATEIWAREVQLKDGSSLAVAPAFTAEGNAAIEVFLDNIQNVSADRQLFESKRELFFRSYTNLYFSAWRNLLKNFEKGADSWSASGKLLDLAKLTITENSPYARLISRLVENLRSIIPFASAYDIPIPAWVNLALQIDELQYSLYLTQEDKGSNFDKYATLAKQKIVGFNENIRNMQINTALGKTIVAQRQNVERAKPYYKEYFSRLGELVKILQEAPASYDLVKVVFDESDRSMVSTKNLIAHNISSLVKLEAIFNSQTSNEKLVWNLLSSQTNLMWRLLLIQSRKYIQQQWDQDILMSVSGLHDWEMLEKFRGEKGVLWSFQEVLAKPFLDRKHKNKFVERRVYNKSIGFSHGFMQSINTQKIAKDTFSNNYAIKISALPTDTNKNALLKPHETKISFKCKNDTQFIRNQNFPVSKIIKWSPSQCAEISLDIYIGNVVLEKKYSGASEMFKFFSDYKKGNRIYQKDEFGDKKEFLAQYNVDTIKVSYVVSGYSDIQKIGNYLELMVPNKIFIAEDSM